MHRLLAASGLFLVLPLVGIPCWIALNSQDLESVDETGLVVERIELEDLANGYLRLEAAAGLIQWPDDSGAPPAPAQNSAALAALDVALEQRSFQVPEYDVLDPEDGPDIRGWMGLGDLLAQRARSRVGDPAPAFRDVETLLELGHRIESARGTDVLHTVVGWSIKGKALDALSELVPELRLSAREAREWVARIEAYRARDEDWRRTWAAEYQSMKGVWERTMTALDRGEFVGSDGETIRTGGWLPVSYLYQHNRTLQQHADRTREEQQKTLLPCSEIEEPAPSEFTLTDKLRLMLGPNSIGRILAEIAEPQVHSFHLRRCLSETQLSVAQALVGLRAHQVQHAELAATLEGLVPTYLPSVPSDGFNRAPLRYDPASRVLSSVAADLEGPSRGEKASFSIPF